MTRLFQNILALLDNVLSAFTVRDALAADRAPTDTELRSLGIDPAQFRGINLH